MWAWLLANVLLPVGSYFLPIVENDVVGWVKAWLAASAQKKVDATNVTAEGAAAASGNETTIAQTGTDLLNGTTPPNP